MVNDKKRVLVALDFPSENAAIEAASRLNPDECRVKVGKELFTLAGPSIVEKLHALGFEIFLDLKFHDIPNTVAKAVRSAAELGVWMVNVHASGGSKMMKAAVAELSQYPGRKPILIGVTVLTSMADEDLHELGIDVTAEQQVLRLAELAKTSGLDGVVCSAREASAIRALCGDRFMLVTPGIRPLDSDQGDQQRIMTPVDALAEGSDYLVIGRPITKAGEPMEALRRIQADISEFI